MKKEAFEKWFDQEFGWLKACPNLVRFIWQYFAPHLRGEFPREAVEKLVQADLKKVTDEWWEERAAMITDHLERLWNGEVPGSVGLTYDCGFDAGYKLRQHEEQEESHPNGSNCPNPNEEGLCGCCLTCGGNGKRCTIGGTHVHCYNEPYPDCTEKPQTFKREGGDVWVSGDQRKGQRRKITLMSGYFAAPIHPLPDRRIGAERRAKTLTGSLKAMRPQEVKP